MPDNCWNPKSTVASLLLNLYLDQASNNSSTTATTTTRYLLLKYQMCHIIGFKSAQRLQVGWSPAHMWKYFSMPFESIWVTVSPSSEKSTTTTTAAATTTTWLISCVTCFTDAVTHDTAKQIQAPRTVSTVQRMTRHLALSSSITMMMQMTWRPHWIMSSGGVSNLCKPAIQQYELKFHFLISYAK